MTKKTIIICFIISFCFHLSATSSLDGHNLWGDKRFGVTFEPSISYLYGQSREIVYDSGGSTTYLSELIWDLKNIMFVGTSSSLNFNNRFFVNIGIWTNINSGNGFMDDFDWLNLLGYSYPTYNDYEREGWTNWSRSEVDIVDSVIFDINISYDFLSQRAFGFSVLAGCKYLFFDWEDKVVDSVYPSGDDIIETGINAIDYELSLYLPYIGIGGKWVPREDLIFVGRFIYSPLVLGGDHDYHILRSLHFYDDIYFGQYIAGVIKIGYPISDWFNLFAQFSGEYLFERRGNTTVYDNSGNYQGRSADSAGIQYQAISFSISGAFSF